MVTEIAGKRVIGVAGFKNSGKTTLVEKLVGELTRRGLRVSTVKHAHHSFDIDHEGRDSFRHRKAGASEVAVISRQRTAIIHELRGTEPPSLEDVIARLAPCDLVIIEGYKRDGHDKIEVRNLELDHPELAADDPTIVAIAASGPLPKQRVEIFGRDDVTALVEFIVRHCGLRNPALILRRAGPGDAEAIRSLTRQVYAKWITCIGREPFPMAADYHAAVREHWIDLFEEGGTLVALIEMVPQPDHLYVENVAVAEVLQGRGIGKRLLIHAEAVAKQMRLPQIRLATNRRFDANLAFYQHLGFEAYQTRPLPDGGEMVCFRKPVS